MEIYQVSPLITSAARATALAWAASGARVGAGPLRVVKNSAQSGKGSASVYKHIQVHIHIPKDPCMEYLPTLTPKVI